MHLDNHFRSPLHKLWRDVVEYQIVEAAGIVTEIVPDSVKNFFAREQAMGELKEKQKVFDSFGELKRSLETRKQELTEKTQQ